MTTRSLRGAPARTSAARTVVATSLDLGRLLDERIYPALFERLDTAFPEFGWERRGAHWVATIWPAGFPCEANDPRPERLFVYADRPWWIKVHGHAGARFLDYVNAGTKPTGPDFARAVRRLAELAGVTVPEAVLSPEQQRAVAGQECRRDVLEATIAAAQAALHAPGGSVALEYLRMVRGLTDGEIENLELGYFTSSVAVRDAVRAAGCDVDCPEAASVLWKGMDGYVVIPWRDATGRSLTLYGRWPAKEAPEGKPKTMALPGEGTKGSPLYFDRAREARHDDLVAVEGVFDAALLQVRGDTRAVAYVAAQFSGLQIETLVRHRVKRVFLCGDPDGGGDRGTLANVDNLSRAGIKAYVVPRLLDGLDPDEFVAREGIEGWRSLVDHAVHAFRFKAEQILADRKPRSGWTDAMRDGAVDAALAWESTLPPSCEEEAGRHLWPPLIEELGLEKAAIGRRRTKGRKRDRKAEAAPPGRGAARVNELCTDMGNARRLARRHGDALRHTLADGWLSWDGRHWLRDDLGLVMRRAKETVRAIFDEAKSALADAPELAKWAVTSQKRERLLAMVELAKSEPEIAARPEDFDRSEWLFNVLNGTLDLTTGLLRPHRREDLVTKLARVNYDPDAKAPIFDRFLLRILPDPEVRAYLQRRSGSCLSGNADDQSLDIAYGRGRNGKSTYYETIAGLLGEYAAATPFSTFTSKRDENAASPDLADLAGARLVIASEPALGVRLNTGTVKQLTGGDTIRARRLYKEHFSFVPQFKLVLIANHKPRIDETTYAIWERVNLLPFTVQIPKGERDRGLKAKLANERPGILAWLVRGCMQWRERGLRPPEAVQAATDEYRTEEDAFGEFVALRCVLGPPYQAKAGYLLEAYTAWSRANGEEGLTAKSLALKLKDMGLAVHKRNGVKWWKGIGLREEPEASGDDGDDGDGVSQTSSGDRFVGEVTESRSPSSPSSLSVPREAGEEG